LSPELLANMNTLEEHSKNNSRILVNVCLDYSGQWDIAQSCVRLVESERVRNGKPLSIDDVVDQLDAFMSTGRSSVDVMIRTGGEHRVSNFLLWQIAYAELCVTDVFWPDFSFELMKSSLEEVAHRNRRFGK
jgi:di-trans,poly-cis-decaprenylcistransferase